MKNTKGIFAAIAAIFISFFAIQSAEATNQNRPPPYEEWEECVIIEGEQTGISDVSIRLCVDNYAKNPEVKRDVADIVFEYSSAEREKAVFLIWTRIPLEEDGETLNFDGTSVIRFYKEEGGAWVLMGVFEIPVREMQNTEVIDLDPAIEKLFFEFLCKNVSPEEKDFCAEEDVRRLTPFALHE